MSRTARATIITLAFLSAAGISTTVLMFLCLMAGRLNALGAAGAMIFWIAAWFYLSRLFLRAPYLAQTIEKRFSSFGWFEVIIGIFYFIFCYREFVWLIYRRDGGLWFLSDSNLGDLGLHIGYVNALARGLSFWPHDPEFLSAHLSYPFGIDLLTAAFQKLGAPLLHVWPLMGLVAGLVTGLVLLLWSGGFALGGFLFSGSVAAYAFLKTGVLQNYDPLVSWKNLPLTLFITQRGFLLALPLGLWLIWAWRSRFEKAEALMPWWVEGIIWGSMPFIHAHTFLVVSLVWGFLVLRHRVWRQWRILIVAVPLACLELAFMLYHSSSANLLGLQLGWTAQDENFVMFCFRNFGLWLPLLMTALVFSKGRSFWAFMAFGLFALCMIVRFAPWDWDNTKILLWALVLSLVALDEDVLKRLQVIFRAAVIFVFFFPGFIEVTWAVNPHTSAGYRMIDEEELDSVCQALSELAPDDGIAVASELNHPVYLCGHPIPEGYAGHIWSHGYDSRDVETNLHSLFSGANWSVAAERLHVRYVFWGMREARQYPQSPLPQLLDKAKTAEGVWGRLYDLKKLE